MGADEITSNHFSETDPRKSLRTDPEFRILFPILDSFKVIVFQFCTMGYIIINAPIFWRICLELFPSVEPSQMKAMDCFRGKPYFYSRDQPSSCPAFSVVSSAKISSIRIPEIFSGEVPSWSANKLGLLKMLKKQFAKVYEKWHPPRIIGPSYRGVWLCIAGFKDLQTTSFEIPWFLGSIWRMQRSGMKSPGWMIMVWESEWSNVHII